MNQLSTSTQQIIHALRHDTRHVAYYGKYPNSDTWYNSIEQSGEMMVCFVDDVVELGLAQENGSRNPRPQKLTDEDVSKIASWSSWKEVYNAFDPTTFCGGSQGLRHFKTINLIKIHEAGSQASIETDLFTISAKTEKRSTGWVVLLDTPNGEVVRPLEVTYKSVHLQGFIAGEIKKASPFLR